MPDSLDGQWRPSWSLSTPLLPPLPQLSLSRSLTLEMSDIAPEDAVGGAVPIADIAGEDLTLGGVWTQGEAAKHFDMVYKFENDTPRGGHVSRDSEVYKCRKYIADVDGHERIYVRVIEMQEGTDYKIEQGYPIGHGDNDDDDEEGGSGAISGVPSDNEEEAAAKQPKARAKRAAAAPEAAPAPEPAGKKRRAAQSDPSARAVPTCAFRVVLIRVSACIRTLCYI